MYRTLEFLIICALILACGAYLNRSIGDQISDNTFNKDLYQWLQKTCQTRGGTGDNELLFDMSTTAPGFIYCFKPHPKPKDDGIWVHNDAIEVGELYKTGTQAFTFELHKETDLQHTTDE